MKPTLETLSRFCLTLPEKLHRTEAAQKHFDEVGLSGVKFLTSINGERFGLKTIFPYAVDDKTGKFFTGHHEAGIFLSHYIAWQVIALGDRPALVMEDDCRYRSNWKSELEAAIRDVPSNFDWLFCGSCCAGSAIKNQVRGNVWDVRYCACWHSYIITPKGAQTMMNTQRKVFGPCDLMSFVTDPNGGSIASFRQMAVYTILPRIADQENTTIPD